MVNYNCPRCGYTINIKTKYVNHLRRKKVCNPIINNCNLDEEYKKYNIIEKIDKKHYPPKIRQNPPKQKTLRQNPPKSAKNTKMIVKMKVITYLNVNIVKRCLQEKTV